MCNSRECHQGYLLDTDSKLNIQTTFGRRPER